MSPAALTLRCRGDGLTLTLKMAILNNQARIYSEMGRREACASAMRSLSATLTSVSRPFFCRGWDVFVINVLMALEALSHAAAA